MKTTTTVDYSLKPLKKEHIEEVIKLFTRAFCDSEPITRWLGITYQDFEPFAREFVGRAIDNKMGEVAVNKDNEVIGCVIAEDFAERFIPHLERYPNMRPVFLLLEELNSSFAEHKKFKKGKIIHMWLAAVNPTNRQHGLYEELSMAFLGDAVKHGYELVYSDFTNELSERIVKQFDTRKLCNRVIYERFALDGQPIFKGLKGSAASYIGTLKPDIKLDSLEKYYTITEES